MSVAYTLTMAIRPSEKCIADLAIPFVLVVLSGIAFLVRATLLVVDFNINLHSIAYVANLQKTNSRGNLLLSSKAQSILRASETFSDAPSIAKNEVFTFKDLPADAEVADFPLSRAGTDKDLEKQRLVEKEDTKEDETQFVILHSLIWRKQDCFDQKCVWNFSFVTFLVLILPVVVLLALNAPVLGKDRNSQECFVVELQVCFVELSIFFIVCIVGYLISRRLKVVQENLGIKSELKKSSYALLFMLALAIPNAATSRYLETLLEQVTGIQFFQVIDLVLPIAWIMYQSFYRIISRAQQMVQEQDVSDSNPNEMAQEFLKLLNSPSGFLLFQEYLAHQLRVEDLLFWKDVERFRAKEVDAQTIYETYLDKNAPLEIEISPKLSKCIRWYFNGVLTPTADGSHLDSARTQFSQIYGDEGATDANIFNPPYVSVFRRMLKNDFKEFRQTDSYRYWQIHRSRNT